MLYDDLTRVQLKKAYTMIAAKPSLEYRTDDETMLILSRAKHLLEYRTDDETTFIQVWNHAVESLAYFTCHKDLLRDMYNIISTQNENTILIVLSIDSYMSLLFSL